jgi:probable F420-dependent oxidoreductase
MGEPVTFSAGMEYAMLVPNWAPYDQDLMIELALEAERLGYRRIFYTDHILNPYRSSEGYSEETVETWALLANLAARTERIRLGTAVTPMALRPPALWAKQVATVDRLSGGRLDVGIGAGWAEGSFGAIDSDFGDAASRKARLREGIELVIKLWESGEKVDFDGRFYRTKGALISPPPVQRPHPPVWIGGWRKNMRELVATVADGWLPWSRPVDFYAEAVAEIRASAAEHGREDAISFGTGVVVVPDDFDRELSQSHHGQGSVPVASIGEVSEAYRQAGAELMLLMMLPDPGDSLELLRTVAAQLMRTTP